MMYLNLVVRKDETEIIHNIWPDQNCGGGQVLGHFPSLTIALEKVRALVDDKTQIGAIKFEEETMTEKRFKKADVGCYGDSARGVYIGQDVVIPMAEQYGFKPYPEPCSCEYCKLQANPIDGTEEPILISCCEFYNEIWDEAETFLNNLTEDGFWFGSTENGDWGLWEAEDD